ncbi:MAG: class II glutamine amidotransferase [Proteobacteria bacterium]|nr:class II glutamine amidotransferase [Pseudomonadota bacterium]
MCELLALSSSQPLRLTFSLQALAARGGPAGRSHDGWGVAFYQGSDVALFREPVAAANSNLVRHLESHGPATRLAISHIRHATQGEVSLANTQPFVRELGGRTHVFAHNGDLPAISGRKSLSLGDYRPVGQTDSEHAFCALLGRMASLWRGDGPPRLQCRLTVLATFAAELRALGPANFLYADGDALFAHGHRRLQLNGRAEPPGLWIRQRRCPANGELADRGAGVAVKAESTTAVWIASVPLTEDEWRPMSCGELAAVRDGEIIGNLPGSST